MRKAEAHAWKDHVDLHARYQRSVHIERDGGLQDWLDGYLLTPLVRSLFARIVGELRADGRTRAWSLTGPYGSGKSAFALFLSQALAPESSARARKLLKEHDPALHGEAFGRSGVVRSGLIPVLATGERAPLEHILVRALARTAALFWSGPGKKPSILRDLQSAVKMVERGEAIPTRRVVAFFEEAAAKIQGSSWGGEGILLILDEAGKPLEHIARQPPDGSDVHLLQELAEAANRSGQAPIVFVALLHQAFERYAKALPSAQRNEWAKVQGRFVDVPFQEAADQILRLIGAALEPRATPPKTWSAETRSTAKTVAEVLRKDPEERRRLTGLFTETLPLHPLTALALGPLFRSHLAQNERSLFAFLAANEPGGFREFLAETRASPDLYGLDRLYDYVKATFGERLYGRHGRTWAQVETGLSRLPPDADELDARVLKAVGVLGAVADDVPASPAILEAALVEPARVSKSQVKAALDRLTSTSHLVFRRFRNAYQLWDGSDLDLDALVRHAFVEAPSRASLHQRLASIVPPRPMLARRHLMTTGTLRIFDVEYVDENILETDLTPSSSRADGFVWLVLPSTDGVGDELRKNLLDSAFWPRLRQDGRPVIIAVPHSAGDLRGAARELGALEWVQTNTPELADDPIARRELDGRISDAERQIRLELEALFDGSAPCDWCSNGERLSVSADDQLARQLSRICDAVYSAAPHVHNELLNRNELSSAAAAARRTLMTAMVENADRPRLGIEGFPPEYSMYRSVLEVHQVHQGSGDDGWGFVSPPSRGAGSLALTWSEIQKALRESTTKRLALTALYARFARPPYGIKAGVLPVLVLAAVLERVHEVAVYQDGGFVPGLSAPVVERMLRAPEHFELQQFRLAGARENVFTELAKSLASSTRDKPKSIVPIVRALVQLVTNLPGFGKNTGTVSARAQRVREALLRAREPGPLLFERLPEACDCEPFGEERVPPKRVHEFTQRLKDALRELEAAYPMLLKRIEGSLREAFEVTAQDASFRDELAVRSRRLLPVTADAKLKGFLVRAADDALETEQWLVSLGTLLGRKPPESWQDHDIDTALLELKLLTRRFRTLETLLETSERDLPAGTSLVRVAIAELGRPEAERVVAIRAADEELLDRFTLRLGELVQSMQADLPRDAIVAALARTTRDLMDVLGDASEGPHPSGAPRS